MSEERNALFVPDAYEKMTLLDVDSARFDQPPLLPTIPLRRYAICSAPRSGSNLLCRLLINAGLGVPHEYFNPRIGRGFTARLGLQGRTYQEYIHALYRLRTTPNGVWGFKLQWRQYRAVGTALETLLNGGTRFVFLYREDVADQAVSLHVANVTGVWGFDGTPSTRSWSPDRLRDLAAIRQCESVLRQENRAWEGFFAQRGIKPLVLVYEQFVHQQAETVERIATLLKLGPGAYRVTPAEPKENRLASEVETAAAELRASFCALRRAETAG